MQKKRPRKVSPRYLERAATFYLDRYDSSAANLKAVLMRKVDRSLKEHGGDRAEAEKWADEVVARFVAAGLVDDTRFAGRKAGSLHRRGNSSSLIRMKLRSKGLGDEAIDVAIDRLKQEAADPDLEAAVGWARRRKLGPWRRDDVMRVLNFPCPRDVHIVCLAIRDSSTSSRSGTCHGG